MSNERTTETAAIIKFSGSFECGHVEFYLFRGRVLVVAIELGHALSYADAGKKLVDSIRDDWSAEFIQGQHFDVLTGDDLRAFKKVLAAAGAPTRISRVAHLMVLYEAGVDLVCIKTDKPAGVVLRRFLTEEVMPKLRRGEAILPSAVPPPVLAPVERTDLQGHDDRPVQNMVSREHVAIFVAIVREVMAPYNAEVAAQLSAVRDQVAEVRVTLAKIEAANAEARLTNGMITKEQAAVFREQVKRIAQMWIDLGWSRRPTMRSAGGEIVSDVYSLIDWGGAPPYLDRMPATDYSRSVQRLARMERDAVEALKRKGPAKAAPRHLHVVKKPGA